MENRRVFAVITFVLALLAPVAGGQQHLAFGAGYPQPTSVSQDRSTSKRTSRKSPKAADPNSVTPTGVVVGHRITLIDGYSFEAEEVWRDGTEIWYRQGKISKALPQASVKAVKPIFRAPETVAESSAKITSVPTAPTPKPEKKPINWVHLVDGARFRVDEVQETPAGYWYTRSSLSVFLERERVARIEIDRGDSAAPGWRGSDWTSGNPTIDELIRANGRRFGVDPYLVFLVIEQESHFRPRAVSPKGARGLMQLMPATARRLGVKNPFDVDENIKGGTQYLRELMDMFGGQVHLVLASYNAGEGAVIKYGRNVPPYRETRDYVKKIGKRYGLASREGADAESPAPRR